MFYRRRHDGQQRVEAVWKRAFQTAWRKVGRALWDGRDEPGHDGEAMPDPNRASPPPFTIPDRT
jgi:hypothetical protein